MNNNNDFAQKMRIAIYIGNIAEETGAQWKTHDKGLAAEISEFLSKVCYIDDPKTVASVADIVIKGWLEAFENGEKMNSEDGELWAYICMVFNWLSWAWASEENDPMTEAWVKAWQKAHGTTIDTLKGDKLKQYLQIVD